MERLTREARQVVDFARDEVRALRHKKVRTEHLLLGLLRCEQGLGAQVLRERGLTLEEARRAVERIAGRGDEELWAELIPFAGRSRRAMELAQGEAVALGHDHVGTEHILLGLLREDDGGGARVLAAFGIDYARARDGVVAAVVSARGRRQRRRDALLTLAFVGVFAAGVLVGRAFRAH
ncbi:MAG: Clp protease N-terminal domain-containing protein [Gaiellaceae bacterium]